jgi:hypothetical protein
VDNQAQLSWEARFAPLAAASAFAAIVFQIASFVVQLPALEDAPGRDEALRFRQTLLNFHDHSDLLLASAITQALGTFLAAGVLFYLFRATRHRRKELPQIVQWIVPLAPILITIAVLANWSGLKTASDDYTSPRTSAQVKADRLDDDERRDIAELCRKEARSAGARRECRATRNRQEAVAKELVEQNQGALGASALFGGTIALAFAYVIIALNAMRAGLLSRFMGVLGIIVGALIVLPLLPQGVPIVQMFWLGALGGLFLGRWPGGRGPAWETGEPDPWPTPERRMGLPQEEAAGEEPALDEPGPEEPDRPHSASKKRKRKRRR